MPPETLTAFRLAAWDTPLWINANRTAARYNLPGEGPTQYLSLHPLTPWAEYLRREARRTPEELAELRLRVWALRVSVPDVLHVTFDTAAELGLEAEDLVSDDQTACQTFAARIRHDDTMPKAIRAPSAALPGTENLVVLGPRVRSDYLLDPIDEWDVPVAHVADDARALQGLLERVRHRGQPHAGLEAWKRGEDFVFTEPPTPIG